MVKIHTLPLGELDNLIYIIEDKASKEAFLVDPAWDIQKIRNYISDNNISLKGILLTHSHYDHIQGLESLQKDTGLAVFTSIKEYEMNNLNNIKVNFIKDGEIIKLGESNIRVLKTPGHTKGSLCYYVDGNLISGDTLFINGCGRCDFVGSEIENMFPSIQKIKNLPDTTIIRPGHICDGLKTSTIYEQKQSNPYLIIDRDDFFIKFRLELSEKIRKTPFTPMTKEEVFNLQKEYSQ